MLKYPLFLLLFLCLFFPITVRADFFEDFSSGNLDQWILLKGNWQYWQIIDGQLRGNLNFSQVRSMLVPNDDAWGRMREYQVGFDYMSMGSSDQSFTVGMTEDLQNYYDFHFFGSTLTVEQILAGQSQQMEEMTFVLSPYQWHRIEILFTETALVLKIDQQVVFEAPASWFPLHLAGKFSPRVTTGNYAPSEVYYDNIEIQNLGVLATPTPTPLPTATPTPTPEVADFPYLRQINSPWSSALYDHLANVLENPSIARYGCALVSVTMLLQYYGFEQLPDGSPLNPATLNVWLGYQDDGYLGLGLLNWLAISRLTRELQSRFPDSPKLEFRAFSGSMEEISAELTTLLATEPVILQQPGHFFVARGIKSLSPLLLSIVDPFYYRFELADLSQIESLRIFHPSQTDLSAILITVPKDWQLLSFRDEAGQDLDYKELKDSIFPSAGTEGETPAANLRVFLLSKPAEGNYQLAFSYQDDRYENFTNATIYAYDETGNVAIYRTFYSLNPEQVLNTQGMNLQLNFSRRNSMLSSTEITLVPKDTEQIQTEKLDALQAELEARWQAGQLSFYLFQQLENLLTDIRKYPDFFSLLPIFTSYYQLDFHEILGF